MPVRSTAKYGSWAKVYLALTVDAAKQPSGFDLTYTTLGKGIAMVGESTAITFQPAPTLEPSAAGSSAWSIDKLGHGVDPEGVQARLLQAMAFPCTTQTPHIPSPLDPNIEDLVLLAPNTRNQRLYNAVRRVTQDLE